MEKRLKICRIMSYVGIAMVFAVYIAMAYFSGHLGNMGELPFWLVKGLQLLLGIGSAFTIAGVVLGLYYKGKAGGNGLSRKNNRR
ncbi:MAG: hypothetical protein AB7D36_02280 [Oscillospiraceae bacterium]